MSEPFLAEIRIMSFDFAPKGWALADGQLLPINQNQALFSLLGTTYGGNGVVNFALPDLRARTPIHFGAGHTLGQAAGESAHTLTAAEMPAHGHAVQASTKATGASATPSGHFLGGASHAYLPPSGGTHTTLRPDAVAGAGSSQPHLNQQPFLALTFCIALQGIFPSPN